MLDTFWNFLINTNTGLAVRILAGVCIFAVLAAVDYYKYRKSATRWKEYLFLLAAVCIAMLYGIANNMITSSISWEYFYYGKELQTALGEQTPPDVATLRFEAGKIGMMATWTVGLLLGVAVLIVNNPCKNLPRLSYRKLYWLLPIPIASAVLFGAVFGILGYSGWLNSFASDIQGIWDDNLWRPRCFAAAWGVHLGGYIGGIVGAIIAIAIIIRKRFGKRKALSSAE
ncbi:MAG: hypothetical protein KAR11_00060 [Phycisphaerae bacterium]|nr:hypothetical protein [Phycisphaerae bacterium]